MPTNDGHQHNEEYRAPAGDTGSYPESGPESAQLGYETRDVNTGGIVVFLAGLFSFVLIFFLFCFFMGRVINEALNKQDGPADKWHPKGQIFAGAKSNGGKRENLKSNADMGQQELGMMTQQFPQPRLDVDDGNQATADLHAREDLLLEHYSTTPGANGGQPALRIPIERAMELIVQRGLPVAAATQPAPGAPARPQMFAAEKPPGMQAPLTSGFARTGYELDTIEAREQKMEFSKGEAAQHAQLAPVK